MSQMQTIPAEVADALLFFSRAAIPDVEREQAHRLCEAVDDWAGLTAIAARKFSLPLVYRNLQRIGLDDSFAPVLTMMHAPALQTTFGALRTLAVQRAFHLDCVAPLGLRHVYVKGPTLAGRYYDDPGLRYARDIDLLVSREDQEKVVRRALSQGYSLLNTHLGRGSDQFERDLDAELTYKTVVMLVSEDGVIIEVHRDIDKKLGIFTAKEVLARGEAVRVADVDYQTMPTSDLLCFVCYHNSRHTWSRLHWIADLDAIVNHPSFDRSDVLARAKDFGIEANVAASLDLHRHAISGQASEKAKGADHGAELLSSCLKNLGGDLDIEYDLRRENDILGLPYRWMVAPDIVRRASKTTKLSKVLPGYEEYEAWPLPRHLQWIYYITKPLGILQRHLTSANQG